MIERLNQLLSRLIHAHALDHFDHFSQRIDIGLFDIPRFNDHVFRRLGLVAREETILAFLWRTSVQEFDQLYLVRSLPIHLNAAIRTHLNITRRQLTFYPLSNHGTALLTHKPS